MAGLQFEVEYGEDSRYECWFGKAVERCLPTIVHGLLQVIVAQLLKAAGFEHSFIAEPFDRSVVEWRDGVSPRVTDIVGVPAGRIWKSWIASTTRLPIPDVQLFPIRMRHPRTLQTQGIEYKSRDTAAP